MLWKRRIELKRYRCLAASAATSDIHTSAHVAAVVATTTSPDRHSRMVPFPVDSQLPFGIPEIEELSDISSAGAP